jgi:ABC-type dipeptide/oligopeptide/nickel transport system permease component
MLNYIIKRVGISIVVLLGIAVATFWMLHLVPGDPARIELGQHATPQAVAHLRHQLGLDQPLGQQFLNYLGDIFTGNLGKSIIFNSSVSELLSKRAEPSAILVGYGLLITMVLGVPMAVIAAVRKRGWEDNSIRLVSTFSFVMPPFWLGLMFALLFGLKLGWFPVSGYESGIDGILKTMTLPAITVALVLLVFVVRNLRSSLVEVLSSEYVEAARMRGFSEARIVFKHAFRNSIIGTVTILGSLFGLVLGVLVIIENVFQIPGIGTLLIQAVEKRDYQLVQALALVTGVVVVIVSLLTDVCHAVIDPRIRLSRSNG